MTKPQPARSRGGTRRKRALRIFVNYRREDSSAYAGRLYDDLAERFGDGEIFIDIDKIEPGLDFGESIERALGSCDVVLAVIGRQWLNLADSEGRRRLDNPDDYVRLELEAALERGTRLIPVRVQGTEMPSSTDLPESLKPLARRHAVELSDTRWRYDVDNLTAVLERVAAESAEREREEQQKLADEEAERERVAAEAEAKRAADVDAGRERAALEQAERERLALEAAQARATLAALEAERAREAEEQAALEQAERERLAAEEKARRLAGEDAERERLAAEAEAKRQAEERAERERLAAEDDAKRAAEEEAERERLAAAAAAKRRAEERAERERSAQAAKAKETRAAEERAERDRVAAERAEQKRAEQTPKRRAAAAVPVVAAGSATAVATDVAPARSGTRKQTSRKPLAAVAAVVALGIAALLAFLVLGRGGGESVPAPTSTSLPEISGTARAGSALTAGRGDWTGSPASFAYQWRRCSGGSSCGAIGGATTRTYRLSARDVGDSIRISVTATNPSGSQTSTSKATKPVEAALVAPKNSALPRLTGLPYRVGAHMTLASGTWQGTQPIRLTYAWLRCNAGGNGCARIPGVRGRTYTLRTADVGHTVRVEERARSSAGTDSAVSKPTSVIEPPLTSPQPVSPQPVSPQPQPITPVTPRPPP